MKFRLRKDNWMAYSAIVCTLLMLIGKVSGLLSISWWVVFVFIWSPLLLVCTFMLLLILFIAITLLSKKPGPKQEPEETEPEDENQKTIFFTNEP